MKKALVLAGGGTRGIYQVGALRALDELNEDDYSMVFGVSVGALNAAMIVQDDIDALADMYDHLSADQIIDGYLPSEISFTKIINEREAFVPALKDYINHKGLDVHPFYELLNRFFDEEKLLESDMDFYCVVATNKDHHGKLITKEMMKDGRGIDWLAASASAYPAFPLKIIDDVEYVDGGYYDNLPIRYALKEGAEKIIAIEMAPEPIHPFFLDQDIVTYIRPREELFSFLNFDKEQMRRAKILGYNDTMKTFGKYKGWKYTFDMKEIPASFNSFYRYLLVLENDVMMATSMSEKMNSAHVITDEIRRRMHVTHLSKEDYYFGMMDSLMDLVGMDSLRVWHEEEARMRILASFAACVDENYEYKPSSIIDIMSYIRNLDRKGIVEKIIHFRMYPDHMFLSEETLLTIYPYETALAEYVVSLMKQLAEE